VMIHSATRDTSAIGWTGPSAYARRQVIWLALALITFVAVVVVDYHALARWHVAGYVATLLFLALVLKVGARPTGATSWISVGAFRFQPSEFAKVAVIVSLAAYLARRRGEVTRWGTVLRSLALVLGPVVLVLKQPDFGTALVILAIWFGLLYLAGASGKHLAVMLAAGLMLFTLIWNVDRIPADRLPFPLSKLAGTVRLREYQKRRLTIFLNPQADPTGSGYQVIQSRIAIGSGQFLGRGLFHSTQGRLRFIPEQRTDFIFSVVGEELGWLGCAGMLALFFLVFWRGLRIVLRADDPLGSLLAAGAVSMLSFHTIVNIGMSINIMPITGIPLPFVSYGGSNLVVSFIAVGLLQNVHARRGRTMFS